MRDRDLVRHRTHDDAGDDGDVEIGVDGAREAPRIRRARDLLAAALGADVEVDPPHRHAAEERDHERADRGRRGGPRRGRGAGDEDGLAERDDDEQRAALGHVRAVHLPVRGVRTAEARNEIARERPAISSDSAMIHASRPLVAAHEVRRAIQNTADTQSHAVMRWKLR